MAHITTNRTGTQPVIELTTAEAPAGILALACLTDLQLATSTGTHTYSVMCETDMKKLTTPGDNKLDANIVVDDLVHFGDPVAIADSAARLGLLNLQSQKIRVNFKLYWAGKTDGQDYVTEGAGFIGAMTASDSSDAPIWMSSLTIEVDGALTHGKTG